MLVKKNVLLLSELGDNSIESIKEFCVSDFLNKLDSIYYTCSSDEKDLSDSVITTSKINKLTDEIILDSNLIKFEYNIHFQTLLEKYETEIREIDRHREDKAIKSANEYNQTCVDDRSKVNPGWRTIYMQLEDLHESHMEQLQIKVFSLGKKDYFCYLV